MFTLKDLHLQNYSYPLPENRIANYPLEKTEHSKLLIYEKEQITDDKFYNIEQYLNPDSLLIFNKTKVVNARLLFQKETGSTIEIFCLEPVMPTTEISQALVQTKKVTWKCFIGGVKKWKEKKMSVIKEGISLTAQKTGIVDNAFLVEFEWDKPLITFGEILLLFGNVPLPPYIKRPPETIDSTRYQTVYAHINGSVAAPTAGLHFTNELIHQIENNSQKNCKTDYITLHVGAGTFKPVSTDIAQHIMHTENISVDFETIQNIKKFLLKGSVIAVGTTSLRTLESLYWIGINILENRNEPFQITQFQPYLSPSDVSSVEAFEAILGFMKKNNTEYINASTGLMIIPGYRFRIVNELITNFHQPKSTLLLLVSAFIGEDWKRVYRHALENNYRFLSYGDACLFKK